MALNLDTRQRAMLQEMGITLWLPSPVVAAAAPQADAVMANTSAATGIQSPPAALPPTAMTPVTAQPAPIPSPTPAPAPATPARHGAAPTAVAPPTTDAGLPAAQWRMAPAVAAYPEASGGDAAQAWLVIWEGPNPAEPLSGEVGKLLDNMLRALRLHHSRHVWIAGLQRPGSDAFPVAGLPSAPVDWQPLQQGLTECMLQTRPARIVVLGLHAARAVLGSQEALGRLRAQVHQVHATPIVVSYDPAYLLRSPHAKPAAWADLCRAHALQPPPLR